MNVGGQPVIARLIAMVKIPIVPAIGDCRFTAIDFESAGATRGKTDVAVQIGMWSWSRGQGHHDAFVSHLATDQPIAWSAQKVHGITKHDLAQAPSLLSLWPECKKRLRQAVLVAHGRGTEKRFLRAFPGHGFGPWVDTLQLGRALWPDLPDHSLGSLCDLLELTPAVRELVPDKTWHDALFDAAASMILLIHILQLHALADRDVQDLLHPDTSRWHQNRAN